ncbi:hypothetical protein ANN_25769 [Periplaneta americana]|uniref:Uncharacterized protein n=1 Tax=Periplaneta americana TaxID=6978 RepID=A0ABQ8S4H8_PERAM|nr:hypothetical protein ANN_25769 [Periplaneta americana]
MDLREVGYDDRDWINLAQDRDRWRAYDIHWNASPFHLQHGTQLDNGSWPHVSEVTMPWYADNNVHRLDWPARSPDLNLIEHLWDELDRRFRSREMRSTSIVQLTAMLQEKWRRMPVDILHKLVESMPDRVAAVIATRGGTRGSKGAKTVPKYFLVDSVIAKLHLVQLPRFLRESLSSVRPVYVIDVYKLTPSNGPKERSRRARDLTVASDNLSAIEFRPGDFFFNVEPVIRNEATHRKIVFRVGILA